MHRVSSVTLTFVSLLAVGTMIYRVVSMLNHEKMVGEQRALSLVLLFHTFLSSSYFNSRFIYSFDGL